MNPPPHPTMPPPLLPTEEERTLAMLCHLLAIFTGFLGPLILWLVKKDESRYVDFHGREALNFQITVMIAMFGLSVMTMILMFILIGFFLVPVIFVVVVLALVAEILAAIAAQKGEMHRYPLCIRFF